MIDAEFAVGGRRPALAPRLSAAAARFSFPAQRYGELDLLAAGYQLTSDFRASLGLKPETLLETVRQTARRKGIQTYTAVVLNPLVPRLDPTPETAMACLEGALDEVETGEDVSRDAADAWEVGDVR